MAGGEIMLTEAVEKYVAMRRATGFAFRSEGSLLQSFAAFSDAAGKQYVSSLRLLPSCSGRLKPRLSGLDAHRRCLNERAGLAR